MTKAERVRKTLNDSRREPVPFGSYSYLIDEWPQELVLQRFAGLSGAPVGDRDVRDLWRGTVTGVAAVHRGHRGGHRVVRLAAATVAAPARRTAARQLPAGSRRSDRDGRLQGPMGASNFGCFGVTAGVRLIASRRKNAQMNRSQAALSQPVFSAESRNLRSTASTCASQPAPSPRSSPEASPAHSSWASAAA